MARSVREVQQNFAELSGYERYICWDRYAVDDDVLLKQKLSHLIPDTPLPDETTDEQKKEVERANKKLNKLRKDLFDSVWSQRKYTNKNLLASIIFVLVAKDEPDQDVLSATEFSYHPVFRTSKCTRDDSSYDSGCCMIFVDEHARVYQNWQAYVENNTLPAGKMIAPRNGIYTMEGERVQLMVADTPASSLASRAAGFADVTSMVGGLGAAAVPVAALVTTVAAPVMLGAMVVGLTAAGYSSLRSAYSLFDRSKHERPIGLKDAEARSSWLGVAGGAVGVGAFGATQFVTRAASAGRNISTGARVLVNGMNISTVLVSGGGVANGVIDVVVKYKDDEAVGAMDLMQLAASLALFTHSAYNLRMASTIINETQNSTIDSLRQNCSRRQRKMFDKLSKESIRINGPEKGKVHIIRNANKIDKQAFSDLYKVNSKLNQHELRPSFAANGEGIVLNNDLLVDTGTLRQNLQHNVGPNIVEQVSQPIPPTHPESVGKQGVTRQLFAGNAGFVTLDSKANPAPSIDFRGAAAASSLILLCKDNQTLILTLKDFSQKFINHIENEKNFWNALMEMAKEMVPDAVEFILDFANNFVEVFVDPLEAKLQTSIYSETIVYRIVKIFLSQYPIDQCRAELLKDMKEKITQGLIDYFDSLKTTNSGSRVRCEKCYGFYSIVDL